MKSRNRLLLGFVGVALLASCQSLELPGNVLRSDNLQEPAATENAARVMMTLPRPRPPLVEPLVLGRHLPEPGIPAIPMGLSIPQNNEDRRVAEIGPEVVLFIPQPEAAPASVAVPYFPKSGRGYRVPTPIHMPEVRRQDPSLSPPAVAETAKSLRPLDRSASKSEAAVRPVPAVSPPAAEPRQPPAAARAEVEKRELLARRGDQIGIDLEGNGWIYEGLKPAERTGSADPGGVDFLSRRSSQNGTSFTFRAVEYGEYELNFQYQDNQRAVLRSQIIHLQVLPEQDFSAALDLQRKESPDTGEMRTVGLEAVPGPPIESADALFDLGEYELALIEYQRNMRSGDPYLSDRLAACYEGSGEHLAAVKYYRENLGLAGEYGDRAALGLIRSGIALKDSPLLLEVLPRLTGLESVQIGAELLEVARYQIEEQNYAIAIQALKQYVDRYPDGKGLDEVYYRLASIYEVDSPHRNIESARDYYRLLYDSFPESRYAQRAGERLNYLNRYFFLVQ